MNAPAKTAMTNIPVESNDAEAASCGQYVPLDAYKKDELMDHQAKQKRDDPRIQHDFSASTDGASAWVKHFVVCVSSGLCLEFADRWDAECCLRSLQVSSVLPK